MSNYLKIYDFVIRHKSKNTNVTVDSIAYSNPELINLISGGKKELSENDQRQLILDGFKLKFTNDLNREILKNSKTKRIVKISRVGNSLKKTRGLELDFDHKIIYGILNAGKITHKEILEKIGNSTDDNEYEMLNGDRIYDDFFFMLHISFKCNIARLIVISKRGGNNIDSVLKKYFKDELFKSPQFKPTKPTDFIPKEYRKAVLNRSVVNHVEVSKSETILTEDDGIEYDVFIKLKPKNTNSFKRLSEVAINRFRRSKVILDSDSSEDQNSELKFSIKDPNTGLSKMIAFGTEDNFKPRLVLDDDEVLKSNGEFDINKCKSKCLDYIKYNGDKLNT